MKIKCPDCPNEIEIDERLHHDDILRHFLSFPHESNPHHLIVVFAELVFKIHEKIESLQSEIKGDHFEECDSGHDFETHQNIEFAIERLKSLVESED